MRDQSNLKRLAVAVLLVLWFAGAAFASQPPKRILLLYEGNGALPAYMEMESMLHQTLREQLGPSLEFYREQIDAERHPQDRAHTIAEIQSRYVKRNIDVVICIEGSAADILPGVPTVYVGNLPDERSKFLGHHGPLEAVWYDIDLKRTVSLAKKLQPEARNVLVISGAGALDRFYLEEFRTQLKDTEPGLKFEYVGNDSVEQLLDRVAHLPRDTIVLPISYSRDPAGNNYIPRDVTARLAQVSAAPVYAIFDTYIGAGTVGGYVTNFRKVGAAAANEALKLLDGSRRDDVVPPDRISEHVFDSRQLKKWGFSEKNLPPGSIVEYTVPTAWELYRWRIVGAVALIGLQSVLILGLLVQRYQRRCAEESLRDMAGRLLQSQDDERRRLARDLHDGTSQHLSGIALCVGQVLADFPRGYDRLRQLLQDSHVASRQALSEVRAISYALHPPILDGLGLRAALQWYLEGMQKRTSFNIDFDAPAELAKATPDAERALFRIVQESVTNVLRHSGGSAMRVKLSDGGQGITLEVEDNGRGMSAEELERVESASSQLGVGISGMRERVRQLHGTFKINSGPGGTRVLVTLPAHKEQYAAHTAG